MTESRFRALTPGGWPAAGVLLLLGACCAPRVIWSGHDPRRELKATVLAAQGEQWLRTSSKDGPRFEVVATQGIVFSPEGAMLAYPGVHDEQWWMIVGEDRLGPWDAVAEPRFSRDGRRFAFVAQTPAGWHAVVDDRLGPPFEAIQSRSLQFSEDGVHVGYVAAGGACAFIVVDQTVGPCRERVRALRVSNRGTAAAVIREGPHERLVAGEQVGQPFDAIGEWVVTDDGRRHAYAARIGDRWVAVVDGVASADCARVQQLRFGDRGRRVAWVCRDRGASTVVIDGVPGKPFPVVSALVLAARAPDYAYLAHDERGAWVVAGGSMQGPFSEIDHLLVSPGGDGLAFLARVGGQTRVVHGSEEVALSAAVEASLVLSEDGRHWAIIDGDPARQLLWLTIDGVRVRPVAPDEVFGETEEQLAAWLDRELREAWQ